MDKFTHTEALAASNHADNADFVGLFYNWLDIEREGKPTLSIESAGKLRSQCEAWFIAGIATGIRLANEDK